MDDGTPNDDVPAERQWARIIEVTRDALPQKVFEVRLDSGLDSQFGWSIYRASRLKNLYERFHVRPPAINENHQLFERLPHTRKANPDLIRH